MHVLEKLEEERREARKHNPRPKTGQWKKLRRKGEKAGGKRGEKRH